MPDGWSQRRLADVVKIKHGYAFAGEYFVDHPTSSVLLTPGNFRIGGGYKRDKLKYYDGPIPDDYVLAPGSLIVTMTDLSKNMDTLGYPAWSPDLGNIAVLHNQRLGQVELLVDDVDLGFIYYVMCSRDCRNEVLASSTGTTVHHTSPSRILKYATYFPPLTEQREISATLRSIDEKIDWNRRSSELQQSLAQELFRRWFVEYEPWNGEAPHNWLEGRLGDVLELIKQPAKAGNCGERPYVPIDMLPMRSLGIDDYRANQDAQSSLTLFEKDDILIGAMRVYFHRVVIAPFQGVTRTTTFVLRPRDNRYLHFALLLCNEDSTIDFADTTSKGSTMPYAVWGGGLADLPVHIPPLEVVQEFSLLVSPLLERIRDGFRESKLLVDLHGALLPALLSGRIRVPEIEEVVT